MILADVWHLLDHLNNRACQVLKVPSKEVKSVGLRPLNEHTCTDVIEGSSKQPLPPVTFLAFIVDFYSSFSMGSGAQKTQAEGKEQNSPFLLLLFCHRAMSTAASSAALPLPLPTLPPSSLSAQTSVPAQLSLPLSDWVILQWTLGLWERIPGFTWSPLSLSGIGAAWWAGLCP